jgi:hypothetical protein
MKKINLFSGIAVCILFLGMSFTSCSSSSTPDPYAGKTDPSTIASANLVAYFPFESATASISKGDGITFNKVGGAGAFVVGRRGNAYQGSSSQAYLQYNLTATSALSNLSEFSYSAWIKTPASTPAGGAASAFNLNGGDPNIGNFNFIIESQSNADSLALKPYLRNSTTVWQGQDLWTWKKTNTPDQWIHIVSTYNKTTSVMTLYVNGVVVNTGIKYGGPVPTVGSQPLLGALTFVGMTNFYIGAWEPLITGVAPSSWMNYYRGMIDELRIYNRALTAAEVTALYNAEITVIN